MTEELTKLNKLDEYKHKMALIAKHEFEAIVTTPQEAQNAADGMKEAHLLLKEVEEARKEATGPLDKMKKQIMDQVREVTIPLQRCKDAYKLKIANYQAEQQRKAREIEAQKRKEAEEAAKAAEEAADKGDVIGFEHNLERAEQKEAEAAATQATIAPKTTAPSMGRATTRTVWVPEVIDESLIPREYLIVNESAIKALSKVKPKPPQIPGVRWHTKSIVSVR